jgi:hypothetical protein
LADIILGVLVAALVRTGWHSAWLRRGYARIAVSSAGIYLLAGAAILACLLVVEVVSRLARQNFLATVIRGKDGRTSTSKTFILLWTLLVGWALIALLIAGELVHTHACVSAKHLTEATEHCKAKHDELGLLQVGWERFLAAGLSGSYLVLLGVPAIAGVAAKGITQSEVEKGGFKAPSNKQGTSKAARAVEGAAEIFSADDGTTDIGDFQYLIFNLLAATYFVVQFIEPNGSGLPNMPDTLLGLTSVSAGLYVGKKAITRSQPKITGVFPQPANADARFTIVGENLTAEPTSPTGVPPRATVDGVPLVIVDAAGPNIEAVLPAALAGLGAPKIRHLVVMNPYGGITASYEIQCQ